MSRADNEHFARFMARIPDPRRGGPPYDPHAESMASILARHANPPVVWPSPVLLSTRIDGPGLPLAVKAGGG